MSSIDRPVREKLFGYADDWLGGSSRESKLLEDLPVEFERYDSNESGCVFLRSSRVFVGENEPHRMALSRMEAPPDGLGQLREYCERFQIPFDAERVGWWLLTLRG